MSQIKVSVLQKSQGLTLRQFDTLSRQNIRNTFGNWSTRLLQYLVWPHRFYFFRVSNIGNNPKYSHLLGQIWQTGKERNTRQMKGGKKMAEYFYYHLVIYYHSVRLNIGRFLRISVFYNPFTIGGHLFFKMNIRPSNYHLTPNCNSFWRKVTILSLVDHSS